MPLPIGTRLGAYEVTAQLGAGGMGEVYRARDAKLKRDVAIKVLPADVAADRERLARFQREAEVLAQLNHPNIAHVYGIEDPSTGSGQAALVMELVDGEDLSQRIARAPVPLDEALPIARQIADALEAAHEAGIVHRDLKPANVKVKEDGTVKVLDFGLAKTLDPSTSAPTLANSPTITSPAMTMRGVILGTAAYMAPEQAKGKAVDKRADIWAFGCVLYEMLTGTRAFKGEDVTDIITSVMRDTPDWNALPAATPSSIRTLLRRCLDKDPRKRAPHIAVARLEIEDAMLATGELVGGATPTAPALRSGKWAFTLGVGAAMAVAASALTLLLTRTTPVSIGDAPMLRFTISLPTGTTSSGSPAVSPDGRFVALHARDSVGTMQVWIRALDGDAFAPVPGTTSGQNPFWSPDSTELGFFVNRKLMRTTMQGGTPREIANTAPILGTQSTAGETPAVWVEDGLILFGAEDGIYQVAASGGTIARVTDDAASGDGPKARGYSWPQRLPHNAGLLYTTSIANSPVGGALRYRPASGSESSLLVTRSRAQYTTYGLLIAQSTAVDSATLGLHAFDPIRGTLDQNGTVLAADASLNFSASGGGVLIYRRGSRASYLFEWVDNQGRAIGDSFDVSGQNAFNLSRDGTVLAYIENGGVMVRDMVRGVATRIAPEGVEPLLSPDGQRVVYSLTGSNPRIMVQPSAGGTPEVVYESKLATLAEDWSSDGRFLAANESGGRGLIIPLDGKQAPTMYAVLPPSSQLDESRFSPDGKWMIYNAADSGRQEVYLIPLPPTGERWQLSVTGGAQGRWRRDGRAVYYLAAGGDLMTLDLQATPGKRPTIGRPQKLFGTGLVMSAISDQYAVNADGSRFLLRRPQSTASAEQLSVIVNWPALLRAKP